MNNMEVDAYSLPIEQVIERWKISLTFSDFHYTGQRDEKNVPIYERRGEWEAHGYHVRGKGIGKTPREAIINLLKNVE